MRKYDEHDDEYDGVVVGFVVLVYGLFVIVLFCCVFLFLLLFRFCFCLLFLCLCVCLVLVLCLFKCFALV